MSDNQQKVCRHCLVHRRSVDLILILEDPERKKDECLLLTVHIFIATVKSVEEDKTLKVSPISVRYDERRIFQQSERKKKSKDNVFRSFRFSRKYRTLSMLGLELDDVKAFVYFNLCLLQSISKFHLHVGDDQFLLFKITHASST